MKTVLQFFNKEGLSMKQQATKQPHPTTTTGKVKVEKETLQDREWDKEHVDEIEGTSVRLWHACLYT